MPIQMCGIIGLFTHEVRCKPHQTHQEQHLLFAMAFLYGVKGWAQLSLFELRKDIACYSPLRALGGCLQSSMHHLISLEALQSPLSQKLRRVS